MSIREATIKDVPDIFPLMGELGYPVSCEEMDQRYKRFLQNSGSGMAVFEEDSKVQGFIAWSRTYVIVSGKTRFHVEAIIVSPTSRKKGVGRKLMNHVEELARNHAPCIVDLTTGVRRAPEGIHDFYKKLGYYNEGPMAKVYLRREF